MYGFPTHVVCVAGIGCVWHAILKVVSKAMLCVGLYALAYLMHVIC